MIIDNVYIYTPDKKFVKGGIILKGEQIQAVYEAKDTPKFEEEVFDGNGAYAIPGLIELHFHGCKGDDFCDGTKEAIGRIAEYEASIGVTAIAPATMTLPVEELEHILEVAAEYKKENTDKRRADLLGINMEGPFISPAKKGAQDERNIIPCNVEICERFLKASDGLVKFIGIAPEESEEAIDFIKSVKGKVNVSLAHTNADYKTAKAAFEAGANHAVHLYNAMPPFSHRAPGVVGAVYDCKHVMPEIICDGIHIHPATVRATFEMMGADRMILISDSMRATGMPTNLMDCMRTVVKEMGLPLETAVACATMNPAKSLGVYDEYGSITEGKKANIVLLDKDLELQAVIKDGVRL